MPTNENRRHYGSRPDICLSLVLVGAFKVLNMSNDVCRGSNASFDCPCLVWAFPDNL